MILKSKQSSPCIFDQLPNEILIAVLALYLTKVEKHRFFSLAKKSIPLLLEIRSFCVFEGYNLERFLNNKDYRISVLKLASEFREVRIAKVQHISEKQLYFRYPTWIDFLIEQSQSFGV